MGNLKNIVLDPVMYAKMAMPLMEPQAIDTLIKNVLPLATLITPQYSRSRKIADRLDYFPGRNGTSSKSHL